MVINAKAVDARAEPGHDEKGVARSARSVPASPGGGLCETLGFAGARRIRREPAAAAAGSGARLCGAAAAFGLRLVFRPG